MAIRFVTRCPSHPAVTEAEEAISLALQTACMAAFDAILVHVVNTLAPGKWHGVKASMVEALHKNKTALTLDIIAGPVYASCDVIFLQEAAAALVRRLERHPVLSERYHVLAPEKLDGKRDQNSIILAAKSRFDVDGGGGEGGGRSREAGEPSSSVDGWSGEITAKVSKFLRDGNTPAPVAPGDLFVVRCVEKAQAAAASAPAGASQGGGGGQHAAEGSQGRRGRGRGPERRRRFVLASFHGDTNGLATVPVIDAVDKHMRLTVVDEAEAAGSPAAAPPPPLLVFGIDANTHATHDQGKQQGVVEFARHLSSLRLATCWGAVDPRVHTTYNARTFLQPQLNKAVRMAECAASPLTDRNPKDHVVFSSCRATPGSGDGAAGGQSKYSYNAGGQGTRGGGGGAGGERVARAGFRAKLVSRDNTGEGSFLPEAPFPTLRFPSDHAIVCAALELVQY